MREGTHAGNRHTSAWRTRSNGTGASSVSRPVLEFETNFVWLPAERTKGWLSSHFDIVDKFSPAERPTDRRAYTQKVNPELDTSLSVFNWLPKGRWLRGVDVREPYLSKTPENRGDREEQPDSGRHAAVSSQLRIPSLTPSQLRSCQTSRALSARGERLGS